MPEFIPARPSELTPAWTTAALRRAGALTAGRVTAVAVEPIGDGGTGLTGDAVRVRLRYAGPADGPETVIAKFPTADRRNRAMLEQFDAYAREIHFYRTYADRVPAPTPAYLGGDFDPGRSKQPGPALSRVVDGLPAFVKLAIMKQPALYLRPTRRRYALLLEDLGADTAVHDLAEPPDDRRLAAALGSLAAVHAGYWGAAELHDEEMFCTLVTTTPGLYHTVGHRKCLPLARERWDWLDDDDAAALADALDRLADDVATINEAVTLVHGDPRSDNVLYTAADEAVLIDWALAAHAHPGWDVGYLLSSCLSADRIGGADPLVADYEAALRARGAPVDSVALRDGIAAAYRVNAVQQLISIPVFHGGYGDQLMADLWMPRIVAGLHHDWKAGVPA